MSKSNYLNQDETKELEFYRSFIKSMNGSMCVLNLFPYHLEWMGNYENITKIKGISTEELTQQGPKALTWLIDSPDFKESIIYPSPYLEFRKTGVYRIKHFDGHHIWRIYSAVTFEKDQEGMPQKCAVISLPVEDLVKTPETLKEFQKYLSQEIYHETLKDLTQRQLEVLKLLAQGFFRKEIAAKLNISPYTVQDHKAVLMNKLNCKNSVDLIKAAQKMGIA